MKTYSAKPSEVTREWYLIDASDAPLGRIATHAASLLLGKGKPMVTAHIDCGDNVVIVNAAQLIVTGNKRTDKMYYNHSGFPGGLRERTLDNLITSNPSEAVVRAIRGMLPDNKLRAGRLARLKVYNDGEHKHVGQNPQKISLKQKGNK